MKDELVLNNTKLIYLVLKHMDLYDKKEYYYDIGIIGLIRAANIFDPDKGYKFSSLATRCIRNEILMDIRRNKNKLENNTVSLYAPIYRTDEDEVALIDTLISDFNMEEHLIEKEQKEILRKTIETLKDEEKELLKLYYNDELTQDEIAKILNISQAHVNRKIKILIKKLKDNMKY